MRDATSSLISIAPSMRDSVERKWQTDADRHATGASMSKSSPRGAFAERWHPPPRNAVECGINAGRGRTGTIIIFPMTSYRRAAGVTEEPIAQMLVHNPRAIFEARHSEQG